VEQIFGQQSGQHPRAQVNDPDGGLQRLALVGAAVAGRPLGVAPTEPRERAWTDGTTIYLDPSATPREQVEALSVQASLLATGGLESDVAQRLVRNRPALVDRYLTIEGHRALEANEELLPVVARRLIDRELAARSGSPAESLELAASGAAVGALPKCFGVIRARKLLTAQCGAATATATGRHAPRRSSDRELAELDDAADQAPGEDTVDLFSSPVGGGGGLGKLLRKMLHQVRKLDGGGPPGADAPTHTRRSAVRGSGAVVSRANAHADSESTGDGRGRGVAYPEWDVHQRRYRRDWCTVHVTDACQGEESWHAPPDGHALRRALSRLGMGLDRFHRQQQGDDVDIDAAVEARVEMMAGSAPDDAVYVDNLRRRRDLSVLLLLDVSGSAAEAGTGGQTVHEQQRWVAAALTAALHELGDRVALYAFRSYGRMDVQLTPVKRFDERYDSSVLRRLHGLKPGAYSRLGAAIRHGTEVLRTEGGTPRRLLVVLSDGLAYDHGYERVYGAADARKALAEAGRYGTGCLCLTIGAGTDVEELRRAFGSAAHATVPRPEQLSRVIAPLFQSALNRADTRRRLVK
jgi:nitric oxide reductase NorD protein